MELEKDCGNNPYGCELPQQIEDLKAQVAELEEWKTIARVMVYAHENCEPRALAEAIEKAKARESE